MRSSGTLFCLASAIAFGAMGVLGKLAYENGATVGTLLSVRFALAAAVFWVIVGPRALRGIPRRDIVLALALGACGYAAQAGGYFAALERIDVSVLALLIYTYPAIVAAAAVAIGRERLDSRKLWALVFVLVGLVLLLASAARSSSASAWPTSTRAASVSRTPRPARVSRGTPVSRSSMASCWDTAEGVNCSASATAAIVPRSSSSRSRRRRRSSSIVQ